MAREDNCAQRVLLAVVRIIVTAGLSVILNPRWGEENLPGVDQLCLADSFHWTAFFAAVFQAKP